MKKKWFAWLAFGIVFLMMSSAGPGQATGLPDTGQTKCYNWAEIPCPQPGEAFYGQDAEYVKARSYTDLGNGIVRDNVTGLEWVRDGNVMKTRDPGFDNDATVGDGMVTWQHALDYVALLNTEEYLGHDDWRLPSAQELSSLVDSSRYNPAIDPIFSARWTHYWSSTTSAKDAGSAWFVAFGSGNVYYAGKTGNYYVRAVRGNPLPANNFINNGDGTITDTATGLMWQQATVLGALHTWQGALAYCENLDLAGHTDWRLPDRIELQSIVDYSRYKPAIDPVFIAKGSSYWSSTTVLDTSSTDAWRVEFGFAGNVGSYGDIANVMNVRAVRSGQYVLLGDLGYLCIEDYHCDEGVVCVEGECAADFDGDGVPDTSEQGPSGDDTAYDGNGDGTADSQQPDVTSMPTEDGQQYVTLESPEGTTLIADSVTNPESETCNSTQEFPFGFFTMTITGTEPGFSTVLKFYLPQAPMISGYYKYNSSTETCEEYPPCAQGQTNLCAAVAYDQEIGGELKTVLSVHLTDGQSGDSDGVANAVIVDPGALACVPADGGCAECLVDGDCPNDSQFCTGDSVCTGGVCGYTGNPCSGDIPLCDENSDVCVECFDNLDCPSGDECINDVCVPVEDTDTDLDGFTDGVDNCPAKCNPLQRDADGDGIGDVCDTAPGCGGCGQPVCEVQGQCDSDNDGIADGADNCPAKCNTQQKDADGDGIGDVCDTAPGCGGCGQTACEVVCTP